MAWTDTSSIHTVRTTTTTTTHTPPLPSPPLPPPPTTTTHTSTTTRRLHSRVTVSRCLFLKLWSLAIADLVGTSAQRRRERRLCSWTKHERMTVAMALAEQLHHSVTRMERDEALRRQKMRASEEEVEHERRPSGTEHPTSRDAPWRLEGARGAVGGRSLDPRGCGCAPPRSSVA